MTKLLLAIVTLIAGILAWFNDKSRKCEKKQSDAVKDARSAHEKKDVSGLLDALDRFKRMR